jgi:hypothetical protein
MKIDAAKVQLRAKLDAEIRAWVRATLEDSSVSVDNFPGPPAFETHVFYKAFRRKLLNANLWEPMQAMLANDRLAELLSRAMKRQERAASDAAQFTLPGFEHLPRRIRVSRSSLPLERVNVGQLLAFADRYEKRASRNVEANEELTRLATMLRDQPPELSVPDALARVNGEVKKAAKGK